MDSPGAPTTRNRGGRERVAEAVVRLDGAGHARVVLVDRRAGRALHVVDAAGIRDRPDVLAGYTDREERLVPEVLPAARA